MLKKRVASPTNAGSVSDSNDASKGANLSDKTTWAPVVLFLGPCYAVKKVQFGRPVEHIDFRDAPRLYETVSLETAVHVWTNTAHEGTTRGLKQHSVFGVSMLERLFSDPCSEMKLCALYFSQQITKREFKDGMRALISDDFVFTSFQIALRRMRTDKKITKMSPTLQIFIPEAQPEVQAESATRLKWAIKYNPEVISFDEGNLLVDQYDVQEALGFACKYGRKVRIARWGEEIADVPLCDLLYLSMVDFLHTGRYIDCEYVARSHAYSEARHRNALGLVATHEDFVFDFGYVLDKEGYVTKFRKPSSTPIVKKFSVADLFRPKKSPTESGIPGIPGSPRARNSFLSGVSMRSKKGELSEEHKAIERQIQLELGVVQPIVVPERAVRFSEGTDNENGSDGEEWAETAAAAARNASKKRTETNWVVFLNHKIPSSAAPLPGAHKGMSRLSSRRGSFLTTGAAESELPLTPTVPTPTSPQHDLQAELGSYSYGLGDKKPYKPAQSSAADAAATRVVWREPTTSEVSPSKLSEANLVRNHSLRMKELEEHEERAFAAQMQIQAEAQAQADAEAEAQAQLKNIEAIQALVLAAAAEPVPSQVPAPTLTQTQTQNKFTATEPAPEQGVFTRTKSNPKRVIIVEPAPQQSQQDISAESPTPVPAPASVVATRSEATRPPRAALSIRIPSDTSMVSTNRIETPVVEAPTPVSVADSFVVPAIVSADVAAPRTSPKYSPRAKLVPSASDESLSQRVHKEEQARTVHTATDEGAEAVVATVLQKAAVFKAVDVQQLHSPTSSSVTTPGTASNTASAAPVVKVHRIATPTAMSVTRPMPRAPSAMEVKKTPAVKVVSVPVRPAAPEETQEVACVHPETAHPPCAPEVEPEVVPVTVREKKEVIEVRIRSQKSTSVRADPSVGKTEIVEPTKEPLTQKKLQQKWAFNTVMRNQAVHN